jgi:hypothetical protein
MLTSLNNLFHRPLQSAEASAQQHDTSNPKTASLSKRARSLPVRLCPTEGLTMEYSILVKVFLSSRISEVVPVVCRLMV